MPSPRPMTCHAPIVRSAPSASARASTSHVLERDGCPLHYWVGGTGGKPRVVFLHGVLMDHGLFEHQLSEVGREHSWVAVDVRGHGLSRPMGEGFTIRRASEDVVAILDGLGIEKAVLVGHSMGGYIAQEVALSHGHRIESLVMVSTTSLTDRQPMIVRLGTPLAVLGMRFLPLGLVHQLVYFGAGVCEETQEAATRAALAVPREDFLQLWNAVMTGFHFERGYSIRHPMLLIIGESDHRVGLGVIKMLAPAWAKRVTGCVYRVIPRAGHNVMKDNPEEFNRVLMEFLGPA